jgi:HAE1 family hydrophobic/amphiphilic exporter-1
VKVDIDRKRMSDLGLSMGIVGATMQNAFAGNTDSKFREGQNEYDINIMMDEFNRENIDDIKGLSFMNNAGQLIRLEQFATVGISSGPSKLERVDKIPSVTIKAQVAGRPIGTVSTEIEEKVEAMKKPIGINAFMNGDIKRQNEAMGSMGAALGISIILVYLIMVALYESFVYPFVVMFSVPVAIVGALLALAINMQNMSVFAMLGVIMLVGLVIKNAILIVDFTNHLKARGVPFRDAIIEASLSRFRPILMTTIAMVIAMIPVAIAKGAGAEWKNSLAWVLIGGLTSSMILTLIVVPIMYYVVDRISEIFENRKKKKSGDTSTLIAEA